MALLLVFLAFLGQITLSASEFLSYSGDPIFHPFTTCLVPKPPGIPLHKQIQAILAQTFVNWFSKGLTPLPCAEVELCLALWKPGPFGCVREQTAYRHSSNQPEEWKCKQYQNLQHNRINGNVGRWYTRRNDLAACVPRFGSRRNDLPHNTSEIQQKYKEQQEVCKENVITVLT